MTSTSFTRKLAVVLKYIFLIIVAFISIFPLLWMLISATNKSSDVIRGSLVPGRMIVENYKTIIASQDLWKAMWTSFYYSTSQTVLSILICSLAGYGFEIFHDKHKDRLMAVLLTAMMVPFASTMIPLFRLTSKMGLLNSALGYVLPSLSTPFLIMLFRQAAKSFPHDIIEASRIDGLNEVSIFFKMFIPTMRSTYAAAMTITFMNAWNSYLWPKVILVDGKTLTMPMLLANFIAGYVVDYGAMMLAVLFATLPTVVIFFVLQKSFTEGISGAVK